MKVQAGHEQEFEQAWKVIAEQTRHVPGNLRQALLRNPTEPDMFIITSDWESREAFGHFERSEAQDVLTAPLRALRKSARMDIQTLVMHFDS